MNCLNCKYLYRETYILDRDGLVEATVLYDCIAGKKREYFKMNLVDSLEEDNPICDGEHV